LKNNTIYKKQRIIHRIYIGEHRISIIFYNKRTFSFSQNNQYLVVSSYNSSSYSVSSDGTVLHQQHNILPTLRSLLPKADRIGLRRRTVVADSGRSTFSSFTISSSVCLLQITAGRTADWISTVTISVVCGLQLM